MPCSALLSSMRQKTPTRSPDLSSELSTAASRCSRPTPIHPAGPIHPSGPSLPRYSNISAHACTRTHTYTQMHTSAHLASCHDALARASSARVLGCVYCCSLCIAYRLGSRPNSCSYWAAKSSRLRAGVPRSGPAAPERPAAAPPCFPLPSSVSAPAPPTWM